MRMEVHAGVPDARLEQEWEALAEDSGAVPWARPGWFIPWWRWMGVGTPLVCVLRGPNGSAQAILPLQRTRAGLASATNWHTPGFSIVAVSSEACRELLSRTMELAGPVLTLDFVDTALAEELADVAAVRGGRSFTRLLESSPYIPFAPDAESLVTSLDRRLLADIRRRERRMAERGEVRFEVLDGSSHLNTLLKEGFTVESSGWKGRKGTAIACSLGTSSFYTAVARWAAERGELRLCFLRLNERAVAFDFSIEHDRVQYLLKTGYDEQSGALAPGKCLRLAALQDCERRGLRSYELLGDAMTWKREWTSLSRSMLQTQAFAPTVAGAAGWAFHARAKPAARVVKARLAERVGS